MGRSMKPETSFLTQFIRDCKPDQLITFEEFGRVIHDDIQKHRTALTSAMRIVERDYGIVMQSVPSVGYRVVSQNSVAKIAEQKGVTGIKRETKRWGDRLSGVKLDELDETGKKDYMRSSTRLAIASASITEEVFLKAEPKLPVGQFKHSKEDVMRAIAYGVS